MKSTFVLSGTSLSSFIGRASNVQLAGARTTHPQGHQHAGEVNGREHGSDDADQQDDREAAHRAGSEIGHDRSRDHVCDVGVENRAEGFAIAGLDGVQQTATAPYLLAYS